MENYQTDWFNPVIADSEQRNSNKKINIMDLTISILRAPRIGMVMIGQAQDQLNLYPYLSLLTTRPFMVQIL